MPGALGSRRVLAPTRRVCLWAAPALLLAPRLAAAWSLPSKNVLRRVDERLASGGALQVTLSGRARALDGDAPTVAVGERWIFTPGRDATVDVNGAGGTRLQWTRRGGPKGEPALLPSELERAVFPRLFTDRTARGLAEELGVDLRRQSLALLGDRPAFLLGAATGEEGRPELWIDHDDFVVLRVRVVGSDRVTSQLDLTEWSGAPTFGRFPQQVRSSVGDRWVRMLDVEEADARPAP